MIRKSLRACFVVAAMTLAACWLTRPLAFQMYESVMDLQDALYTVWALDHNFQVMLSGNWSEYWRAPMLTPYSMSLVLADPHLGTALWTWPAYWFSGSAVFSQNVAILGSFVLTGCACYLLASLVTERWWLALAIGLAAAAIPFRQAQLLHLQVLMTQWLPMSVWCVLKYRQAPRLSYVVGLGASAVLTLWSALYYGLFELLLLGPMVGVVVWQVYRSGPEFMRWGWSGVAAALLPLVAWFLLPFLVVYSSEGFERSLWDVVNGSAVFGDLLKVTDRHWVAQLAGLPGGGWEYRETALFPGFLLSGGLMLSLAYGAWDGAAFSRLREAAQRSARRIRTHARLFAAVVTACGVLLWWLVAVLPSIGELRMRWRVLSASAVLAILCVPVAVWWFRAWRRGRLAERGLVFWCWTGLVVFLLLSFGPLIRIHGEPWAIGPYGILYQFVPGFGGMRVPARMCVLFLPLLVLLAAHAFHRLGRAASSRQIRFLVPAIVIAVLGADYAVRPVEWMQVPDATPTAFRWLKHNGRAGGVFVMPADTIKRQPSPVYLFHALEHRRPLLNGYPAFMPADCERALELANWFPQPRSLEMLRARGIAYVVVDHQELPLTVGPERAESIAEACMRSEAIRRIDAGSDVRFELFEIPEEPAMIPERL